MILVVTTKFSVHIASRVESGEMPNATPNLATKSNDGSAEIANVDSQTRMMLKSLGATVNALRGLKGSH
jgi:hypothetical protein